MPLLPTIFAAPPGRSLRRSLARFLILAIAGLVTHPGQAARPPEPRQRIALEPFGFQSVSARYLLEGATMLTVDYVDAQHLLVTFGVSKLMPRLPDCPEEDQDRTVRAVLIELPTGRELAHTEWRFHDLGQYLWSLGGGHFLLRQRDTLTTFAPIQNLAAGEAFLQRPFLHFDRRIEAIVVSADHDILSIETVRNAPKAASASILQAAASPQPATSTLGLKRRDPNEPRPDPAPIEITFLRLLHQDLSGRTLASDAGIVGDPISPASGTGPTRIIARLDGRVRTAKPVKFPITAEGILEIKSTASDGVNLDFLTFSGKVIDLGDFATSCPVRPTFVSQSEFVAFGCRGSDDSVELAGFNLRGDFLWQTNFTDLQAYPSIVSSIPAGRFALSRTTTLSNVFGSETPSASQLTGQEVRVIQTYNGKQLLRVVTSPIQRAGQNFTLSPDGMSLAVLHTTVTAHGAETSRATAVEIYGLPPLSGKDLAELKAEAALAPAPSGAKMRFSIDEIKEALETTPPKTDAGESAPNFEPTHPVLAAVPPAPSSQPAAVQPANGSIPASDAAPACATLTDTAGASCPVMPKAEPGPASIPEAAPDPPRRKPPTLYEPAPANSPNSQ